ncbi:1-acyl-sn-glycerol-3-phosphate acyltransferase [[Mycoplasma] cavipharyngis]|uniref:lysophospholipid acyltransferase family protein n=1 Tax=[Mycoplasma] cavipharyngis TaxID=92757 RepID=UPI0037042FDD
MKTKILKFLKILIAPLILLYIFFSLVFAVISGRRYVIKFNKGDQQNTSKQVTKRYSTVYKIINSILFFKNIEVEVQNLDVVPKTPVVFLANHKSKSDPLVLYKIIYENKKYPLNTFVAKIELAKSKIGYILDLIDVVFVDRKNPRQALKQLEEVAPRILKNNRSLCIFPEATRVPGDQLGTFNPGATLPAYQAFVPIVPVTIYNSEGQFLDKSTQKQTFRKPKSNKIIVYFHKPISTQKFINLNNQKCIEIVKQQIQKQYNKIASSQKQHQSKAKKSDHQEVIDDFKKLIKSKKKK